MWGETQKGSDSSLSLCQLNWRSETKKLWRVYLFPPKILIQALSCCFINLTYNCWLKFLSDCVLNDTNAFLKQDSSGFLLQGLQNWLDQRSGQLNGKSAAVRWADKVQDFNTNSCNGVYFPTFPSSRRQLRWVPRHKSNKCPHQPAVTYVTSKQQTSSKGREKSILFLS